MSSLDLHCPKRGEPTIELEWAHSVAFGKPLEPPSRVVVDGLDFYVVVIRVLSNFEADVQIREIGTRKVTRVELTPHLLIESLEMMHEIRGVEKHTSVSRRAKSCRDWLEY